MLDVTPNRLDALESLRAATKFAPDGRFFYPGAPTEAVRVRCQARIDALLSRLASTLRSSPTKEHVLSEAQTMLSTASGEDSEEQDQTAHYVEQILEILGIESSDGLLNSWRYGFDPTRAP